MPWVAPQLQAHAQPGQLVRALGGGPPPHAMAQHSRPAPPLTVRPTRCVPYRAQAVRSSWHCCAPPRRARYRLRARPVVRVGHADGRGGTRCTTPEPRLGGGTTRFVSEHRWPPWPPWPPLGQDSQKKFWQLGGVGGVNQRTLSHLLSSLLAAQRLTGRPRDPSSMACAAAAYTAPCTWPGHAGGGGGCSASKAAYVLERSCSTGARVPDQEWGGVPRLVVLALARERRVGPKFWGVKERG